nr:immunoglobulin heavy chain junction region [Macaca mulatta]
CVRRHETYDYW